MIDNSRDAFAIAEARLGYSLNTEDPDELRAAADLLREQLPVLQAYNMDGMYDLMENEEAWIAPYYAGDAMMMIDENPDLAFYLPEEETFNIFIDAMCIPASAEHKEEAELFINFLTSPEISGGNMDYIGYGTPVSAAKEYMDPEMATNPVAYPDEETLANGESFIALSDEATGSWRISSTRSRQDLIKLAEMPAGISCQLGSPAPEARWRPALRCAHSSPPVCGLVGFRTLHYAGGVFGEAKPRRKARNSAEFRAIWIRCYLFRR